MATTGFWPVYNHLKETIAYAENPDKTIDRKFLDDDLWQALQYVESSDKTGQTMYVSAINCPKQKAYEYMMRTKRRFHETGKIVGNIRNGDGLAFNYTGTEGSENMVYEYWNTHAIDIVSVSGKKVEGFPEEWAKVMLTVKYEEAVVQQDKAINRPDFTAQSQILTKLAGSDGLPNDATGELKIIPITPDMVNGDDPNSINADLQKKYVDDPSLGSYATYAGKNSKDGLCTHNPGETDPCITFNFLAMQAFRVNVRVFDHMGHFVSQYSQEMGVEESGLVTTPAAPELRACISRSWAS